MLNLTPEAFASSWGAEALVRLPTDCIFGLPADARDFLSIAGMPALITFMEGCNESKITFCRLTSGITALRDEPLVGPPLTAEWSVYAVIGDEFFCNGSAWWCIHQLTGEVNRVDLELKWPVEFVNSSISRFAAAMLIGESWSHSTGAEGWFRAIDAFERQLAAVDPACMKDRKQFWPRYLDFIREEGPQSRAFVKGNLADGQLAFQEGSW